MREIKFRVWDKEEKLWVAGWTIGQQGTQNLSEHKVFMQYTGLKDKNDREIYEGDIFLAKMYDSSPESTYVKVIFDEGSFQVEDAEGYRFWNDYLVMTTGEVIGNVWEHPELLEPAEEEEEYEEIDYDDSVNIPDLIEDSVYGENELDRVADATDVYGDERDYDPTDGVDIDQVIVSESTKIVDIPVWEEPTIH